MAFDVLMTDDDRYDTAAVVRVSSLRATVKKHDNNPDKFRRDKLGSVSNYNCTSFVFVSL